MAFDFEPSIILETAPQLLGGMKLTLIITLGGLLVGLLLGVVTGLANTSRSRFLRGIAILYIEAIRGTPLIVQVMFLYFGLPLALGMRIPPDVAGVIAITKVAALAYLMFNLYTPPCFAAIGAMHSEIKSAKWLWGGIGLQLGTGYTVGFLVYQIGTLITTGSIGAGFVPGLIAVIVFAAVLVWLCLKADKDLKQEYALNGARA